MPWILPYALNSILGRQVSVYEKLGCARLPSRYIAFYLNLTNVPDKFNSHPEVSTPAFCDESSEAENVNSFSNVDSF